MLIIRFRMGFHGVPIQGELVLSPSLEKSQLILQLKDPHARSFTHTELRNAMMETIKHINRLSKDAGVASPHLLNYVVTDGKSIIATRYVSSPFTTTKTDK
jgi:hypothetical protein